MNETLNDRGTLKPGEFHPAASAAMVYIRSIPIQKLYMYLEAFSSCAIESNRLSEICSETLNRIMNNQPVSDRYLLGLAWTIKTMEEEEKDK